MVKRVFGVFAGISLAACAVGSSYEDVGFSTPVPGTQSTLPNAPTATGETTSTQTTHPMTESHDAGRAAPVSDGGMRMATVLDAGDDSGASEQGATTWTANATAFRCRRLERFAFTCPAGGTAADVWGSSIYADDSSICTAAVHDGKITTASGGRIVVEMRPGERIYRSTSRNGVTTKAYSVADGSPDWPCSFVLWPW